MLKGIKTTINKPEVQAEKSTVVVDSSVIKQQAMMQEEDEVDREELPIDRGNRMKDQNRNGEDQLAIYKECYNLFLSGNSQLLAQKLKGIKKEVQKVEAKTTQKTSSRKFEYNMNFDDEDKQLSQKQQLKKRNKPIMASNRIIDYCLFCPDNEELELLSASNYVYLALPKYKTFKNYHHFILAPVDHEQTMVGLNQDILTQISNYKKCLLQTFDKIGMQVVFFQQFSRPNSHIYVQCLAMSYARAQDLPFFFKQGLEDIEGNWTTHKNVMRIDKQKGGLQRQIPKQIKYFYIDFSVGYGYAHVIENQKFWKRQFCNQILATALGMQTHQVKTTEEYQAEEIAVKRDNFNRIWKEFDWTQLI